MYTDIQEPMLNATQEQVMVSTFQRGTSAKAHLIFENAVKETKKLWTSEKSKTGFSEALVKTREMAG